MTLDVNNTGIDYETWYSPWMKQLASNYSLKELEKRLGKNRSSSDKATKSHLNAIQKSISMNSNSMRRAHARNVVSAIGEERIAINGAIEIHKLFPDKVKKS